MVADHAVNANPWELSLYELNRTPQELITDSTEIAVSPRSINSELTCPICLDLLKNTMTTKECLHRFCYECINTALRSGNKECPTCRKKLVSKRSLRPDPNFDQLISKIYPNRESYEAHMMSLNFRAERAFPMAQQLSQPAEPQDLPEIELELRSVTSEDNQKSGRFRYLKTTPNATVDHLTKYLTIRHSVDPGNNKNLKDMGEPLLFDIYEQAGPGEYKPLEGNKTLEQICEDMRKRNKAYDPLILFYAYKMEK